MNTKRIFFWTCFVLILGLIVYGLAIAMKKSDNVNAGLAKADKISVTDHIIGASTTTAKVTLIEYSDYQCPACASYFPLIERLVEESSTTMVFAYRNFPLSQHKNAIPSASAAEAAAKQGKFWEMYRLIFKGQKEWENADNAKDIFIRYAQSLGLNIVDFNRDMDSTEIRAKIMSDLASGEKIGINATPTFFVNGKAIENPTNYEAFKKIIDSAAR